MIGKWCDLLLRHAARRWPGDMSTEMLAEWRAELQAMPGNLSRLWFAISLATSRPHREPAPISVGGLANRPRFGSIVAISLTPLVASAFVYSASRIAFWASYQARSDAMPSDVMATIALAVVLILATAAMAWWGVRRGRSVTMRGPATVAILAGSVAVAAVSVPGLAAGRDAVRIDLPAVLVWIPLLALALTIATRLSKAGRLAWAWVAGAIAALLFADLAIVAQVYSTLPASMVSWPQAAAGLFQQLTGWQFTIELPAGAFHATDPTARTGYSFGGELGPVMLLCSAFALAFAIETARAPARAAREPGW